jgi:hypothetical protein
MAVLDVDGTAGRGAVGDRCPQGWQVQVNGVR